MECPMPKLPLAVDIADAVTEAVQADTPLDVKTKAGQLLDAHPDADVTSDEIADTLQEESDAAGLSEDEA